MTSEQSTRTIPFAFTYGMDAVIPTEIGLPTAWTTIRGQREENQEFERYIDWSNEARRDVAIWVASNQQRAIAHYYRMTQPCAFRARTLVLRKVFENITEKKAKKL